MAYKDSEKQKQYQRDWYQKNREAHSGRTKLRRRQERKELKDWFFEYKSTHPCVDCGEADPIVLEFDHLRDKNFSLAEAYRLRLPIEKILDEIAKCEVRCANCHRRITYLRRQGPLA